MSVRIPTSSLLQGVIAPRNKIGIIVSRVVVGEELGDGLADLRVRVKTCYQEERDRDAGENSTESGE